MTSRTISITRSVLVRSVGVSFCGFLLASCIPLLVAPDRSGAVWIDEPAVATAVDDRGGPIDPTTSFRATDQRIYCTVAIRGPDGVRLGARWYYGDKLIYDKMLDLGKLRRATWWLEMGPGQKFPEGKYRIEIYVVKDPVRTVTFEVTK